MSKSEPGIVSRLAGQSGLVLLGNLCTLFVGIPLQIYLARTLGAEQLGAFGLFEVIAQTAASLFGLGLGFTLVRFIPQQIILGQNRHVRKLLGTVYLTTFLAGTLAAALLVIAGPWLIGWMPELQAYASLFPFVGAMALLGMLMGISQQALRAFFDIRYMVLVSTFLQLTLKVVIALTLIWWGWALMGYLVAVVVSTGLALAGMAWGLRGHIQRLIRTHEEVLPETCTTWKAYARTMYANSVLGLGGGAVERFLLASAINLASVGMLMAVRQLQSLPQVLLQIISVVIAPMFVAAKTRDDMDELKHLYYVATDWVCRFGFPLVVFLFVFGYKVLDLYGTTFAEAGRWPLLIMVAGQFINLLTGPIGIMLNMLGHEKKMFQLNLVSNGLFFLCLLALVSGLGLLGVALGSVLSMLYLNLAMLRVMKKRLGIGWWSARYKRLLAPLLASLIVALFADAMNLVRGIWSLAMVMFATYGVFILVYLLNGLSQEDKEVYFVLRSRLGLASEKE